MLKKAKNVASSDDHRAEQRQEHADTGGRATAQRDRIPPGPAPDPELKMQGIDSADMSYKWFSCTVATPGRHPPYANFILHCLCSDGGY